MQKLFLLLVLSMGSAVYLPILAQNNGVGGNELSRNERAATAAATERSQLAFSTAQTTMERLQVAVAEKDLPSATVLHQDMLQLMKTVIEDRSADLEAMGQNGPSEKTKTAAQTLSRMKILFESSVAYQFTEQNESMKDQTALQRMQEFVDLIGK